MDTQVKSNIINSLMTIKDITDMGKLSSIVFNESELLILNGVINEANSGKSLYKVPLSYIYSKLNIDETKEAIDKLKKKVYEINPNIDFNYIDDSNEGLLIIEW